MKKYIKPNMRVAELNIKDVLLTESNTGVTDGQSLGNEFDENDVSYSRENTNLWDKEW